MVDLTKILKTEFPELEVDIPSIPLNSRITEEELTNAIRYINRNKLFQDVMNLVPGGKVSPSDSETPLRDSVTYPIIFPDQKRGLSLKIDWIQGPNTYIGWILSSGQSQARMYGMHLKWKPTGD
ncbi:hypothetical protein K8R33_00560 [archaeon]|nr:hypothetical protein [archaeon]